MRRLNLLFAIVYLLVSLHVIPSIAEDHPNFLWIMSEDNSKHYLSLFDPEGAETPNIASMAKQGVVFDRAFSNAPVCSVARTTLITMVYAPRIGAQCHRPLKRVHLPAGWKMFPKLLRENGYYTTNNSKTDYNTEPSQGVWDESSRKAHWKNRPKDKPFFHVQTFTDSHESSLHFAGDWQDQPHPERDPKTIQLAPYHPDTPLFRWMYSRYHDRIRIIDDKVGRLLKELDAEGELENTFVFYFGDHGGVLPRSKGFLYESGLHVPLVVRVPENWKQLSTLPRGARTDGFVEFVDFGPTVLNLAGIEIPDHVDGIPFLGETLTEADLGARDETIGYADRMDEKYDLCRSLRIGNWKYIRNYQSIYPDGIQNNYRYINPAWRQWRELNRKGNALTPAQAAFFQAKPVEQLFDLSIDPHEVTNLAKDPVHRKQLLGMRAKLNQRLKAMPDLGFIPESELVSQAVEQPVAYGRQNRAAIARYIEIADLSLAPFAKAKPALFRALNSTNEIERYWGYSVCSIFGKQAGEMVGMAESAVAGDSDLLVRLRAAEFLAIATGADPTPTITEIVKASESPAVTLMALQSIVHFKDGPFGLNIQFDSQSVRVVDDQVMRRIGYLDGLSEQEIRERMKALKPRSRSSAKKARQ